jgi:hypothetical protein
LCDEDKAVLNKRGIELYMAVVGSLIWIASIRLDILFTVMYLSWSTREPREHHLKMAKYCIEYLYQSRTLPLVLGGSSKLDIIAYTDASLGSAVKGRSVTGHLVALGEGAGAVYAKATATKSVVLSSFEAELDGLTSAMKSVSRVRNILTELQLEFGDVSKLMADNKAMVDFVRGEGVAKGVRHMELRQWYVRTEYKKGNTNVEFMSGVDMPADKLTKLGNRGSHGVFVVKIMGLGLLDDYHEWGKLGTLSSVKFQKAKRVEFVGVNAGDEGDEVED